jgi:hypothetical protein
MKRIAIGLALLAMLAVPVHAQEEESQKDKDNLLLQEWKNKQRENADVEKQYKRTMQQLNSQPTAAANKDPWANMRGTDASKPKR